MMKRRKFLAGCLGAGVASTFSINVLGANERIVTAVMGIHDRGMDLAKELCNRGDVELRYLADPDSSLFEKRAAAVASTTGRRPECVQDFRRVLDDPEVDGLCIATPDHWHALATIMACQAGKDVYVEKPMSHNAWEGRKLVEVAAKHKRVIQVGMQSRSAPYAKAAADYIKSGQMGDIRLVRVFNMMQHAAMKKVADQAVPETLDYDLWCGPAAKPPYNPGRYWLNFSEYSCGPIPGDAVHQLDLARMLMGDPPPPKFVSHTGGIQVLNDGRDTPDTQLATFAYDDFTLQFEASLWTPYMKKIAINIRDGDLFPEWQFCATRIEVFGTKAFMYCGRHGGGWQVFNADNKVIEQRYGRQGDAPHIQNFLDCVRSRQQPAANAEQGHQSALLCHLANSAWRAGNRSLHFDRQTETFPEVPEANVHLKRAAYRAPWAIPEKA